MKRIEFKTKRLVLRPLKNSDYAAWYDAYVNGHSKKSKWDRNPLKPHKCSLKWFNKIKTRHADLAKKDDCYVYSVFNHYWGKGYGQEAAAAGLKIGFKQLKLNRLEAAINLDNKKSIRLVKSIGMHKEGIKKRYWFEDGKWVDHLIYVANPEHVGLRSMKPF